MSCALGSQASFCFATTLVDAGLYEELLVLLGDFDVCGLLGRSFFM